VLPGKRYTPEDILRIVWRRKWLLVVPFLVASTSTYVVAKRLPNRYRSETVILVVPQRVPESYVKSTVTARIEDRIRTLREQILTRSRLEPIIQEFGLYPQLRQTDMTMEEIVGAMRGDIQVKLQKTTETFNISYSSGDPRTAQRVTQRLASAFIEENLRDRAVMAEGTNQFIDAQLEDAKRRLIEHEKKLEEYNRRYSGQLPSQVSSNLQAMSAAQSQLESLAESMIKDRERRLELERQVGDLRASPDPLPPAPPAAAGSAANNALERGTTAEQLEAAVAQLRLAELRYKPEHPDIITLKRLIQDLEVKLQAEVAERAVAAGNPPPTKPVSAAAVAKENRIKALEAEIRQIDKDVERKQSQDKEVRERLAVIQAKVDAAPTRGSELIELTRDYSTLQKVYTDLLGKREESKVAANLEQRQIGEQFKVLDPARVPEVPDSPNRKMLVAMGSMMGLGFGVLLAGFLEYRDSTFKNEDDVLQVLQLPVLALVPMMASERDRRAKRRRKLLVGLAVAVMAVSSAVAVLLWRFQAS
jgi:polysaccharide chain length determinant protein (PEP-CTERM system associated)